MPYLKCISRRESIFHFTLDVATTKKKKKKKKKATTKEGEVNFLLKNEKPNLNVIGTYMSPAWSPKNIEKKKKIALPKMKEQLKEIKNTTKEANINAKEEQNKSADISAMLCNEISKRVNENGIKLEEKSIKLKDKLRREISNEVLQDYLDHLKTTTPTFSTPEFRVSNSIKNIENNLENLNSKLLHGKDPSVTINNLLPKFLPDDEIKRCLLFKNQNDIIRMAQEKVLERTISNPKLYLRNCPLMTFDLLDNLMVQKNPSDPSEYVCGNANQKTLFDETYKSGLNNDCYAYKHRGITLKSIEYPSDINVGEVTMANRKCVYCLIYETTSTWIDLKASPHKSIIDKSILPFCVSTEEDIGFKKKYCLFQGNKWLGLVSDFPRFEYPNFFVTHKKKKIDGYILKGLSFSSSMKRVFCREQSFSAKSG